ncbi:type II secretion system protein M [soil metagenome]
MIAGLNAWWRGLSQREQVLVGIMGALFAIVILWLGFVRPLENGVKNAVEQHGLALDRNAAVRNKVAALKALPTSDRSGSGEPLAQRVGESAGEAGFTLERSQEQGPGRLDIAIASVRPQALFAWLASLEGQGIKVETFSAQPSGTSGTISVQTIVQGSGQ